MSSSIQVTNPALSLNVLRFHSRTENLLGQSGESYTLSCQFLGIPTHCSSIKRNHIVPSFSLPTVFENSKSFMFHILDYVSSIKSLRNAICHKLLTKRCCSGETQTCSSINPSTSCLLSECHKKNC